jgi:hypothetical protein
VAYVTGLDPRSTGQLQLSTIHAYNQSSSLALTDIMADNDLATRAPESDAQEKPADTAAEQSVFPGDTPAQAGPTMGVSQHAICNEST